jgi:quercetin dioxygenase-like cupin family protein
MESAGRDFSAPDEVRPAGRGGVDVMKVAGATVMRVRFEPGWRWSEDVKPIVNTDSCQGNHLGYVVSGSLGVKTSEGEELIAKAGDVYVVSPGHDAWVVGDETFVGVEFEAKTAQSYAKK